MICKLSKTDSRTLSATIYLLLRSRARYTLPNLPLPSGLPMSKSLSCQRCSCLGAEAPLVAGPADGLPAVVWPLRTPLTVALVTGDATATLPSLGAAAGPGGVADALPGRGGGGGIAPSSAAFCRLKSGAELLGSRGLRGRRTPAWAFDCWSEPGAAISATFRILLLLRLAPKLASGATCPLFSCRSEPGM